MCWYSAEHLGQAVVQAEVGQRLCVRKMHWGATRWVVREADRDKDRPAPVCLLDGTRVVLRPTEAEQVSLRLSPEPEAVFRMLTKPKRDVFETEDGWQREIDQLPTGLIFDVLVVPGKEHLSTMVTDAIRHGESLEKEPVLARLMRLF